MECSIRWFLWSVSLWGNYSGSYWWLLSLCGAVEVEIMKSTTTIQQLFRVSREYSPDTVTQVNWLAALGPHLALQILTLFTIKMVFVIGRSHLYGHKPVPKRSVSCARYKKLQELPISKEDGKMSFLLNYRSTPRCTIVISPVELY